VDCGTGESLSRPPADKPGSVRRASPAFRGARGTTWPASHSWPGSPAIAAVGERLIRLTWTAPDNDVAPSVPAPRHRHCADPGQRRRLQRPGLWGGGRRWRFSVGRPPS